MENLAISFTCIVAVLTLIAGCGWFGDLSYHDSWIVQFFEIHESLYKSQYLLAIFLTISMFACLWVAAYAGWEWSGGLVCSVVVMLAIRSAVTKTIKRYWADWTLRWESGGVAPIDELFPHRRY